MCNYWSNRLCCEAADRAMQVQDDGERQEAYAQIQQRVMAKALIVPIRDQVNLNAAAAHVTGLRYDAQGWFPWLYDVQIQ